jgi:uncharacterized membrane protein
MGSPVLALHIAAGIAGLISGTAAMTFRKGSERHRLYGNVFVVSMLMLGLSAAYLAIYNGEFGNLVGGIFTVYMVGTAWATARRNDGEVKILDWVGFAAALIGGALLLWMSVQDVRTGTVSAPTIAGFFLAATAFLCALGDMRMIRGGLSGSQRIARHLWRMCFAFFVATGSFFLGRIRIFPHLLRELYIPWILAFLPLLLMIVWLIHVRSTRRPKMRSAVQAA